jgi:rhodanese-related sulfurtransferase
MPGSIKEMLAAANASVRRLKPQETRETVHKADVLLLDVRDAAEVQVTGKIKGALNVSRGMLEFRADPESPYYNPAFRKDKTVIVYCASGGRAALVGKTLQDFSYGTVCNGGSFKELAEAGLETEPASG